MFSSSNKHLVLVYLVLGFASAYGVFFAVAPKEFRPGWPLTIAVTTHQNVSGKVFVNVALGPIEDEIDVYSAVSDSLNPGETKTLTMQIPEIVLAPHSLARLSVVATGAITYNQVEDVKYNPSSSLVFVETDKAIYKPGQKVQIRVVHVDKSLKPVIKPLTAFIINPKDTKLEEYKGIASRTGVIEIQYELSKSASLGNWTVQVTDDARMLYMKSFMVEEYVLPKFSVEVKANPGYLVLENEGTGSVVTVESLYTYGRGVQGSCVLTLSDGTASIVSTKQLNHLGKAEFTDLEWSRLTTSRLRDTFTITATASVSDETGRTETGQSKIMVYKYNTKVQILPKTTKIYRIGLPAEVFIRVSDQNGNPINSSEVKVQIHLRGMKDVITTLTVPEGETDVSFKCVTESAKKSRYSYWMDNHVQVRLVSNPDIEARESVYLYQTKYGSVVSLQPTTDKIPVVGDTVQFNVSKDPRDWQYSIGYVVVSQGNIVAAGAPVDDIISITPTLEMCPHAELLVYMIAGGDKLEVVTDVFTLSPTRCFQKEVAVSFDTSEVRSGTETKMKIRVDHVDGSNAMPGIHNVYYLAVDKSLVLLQGRTDLSREEVLLGLARFDLKDRSIRLYGGVPHSAASMIEDLGLRTFTSAHVKKGKGTMERRIYYSDVLRVAAEADSEVALMKPNIKKGTVSAGNEKKKELKKAQKEEPVSTKIRKNFPETWLWGHAQTHMNGHLSHAVTLPDTITTWMVSAFAINDEGLAVGRGPTELAAFQMFFLSMNLPYSIKRGEVFVLRVTVFNYRKKDVSAVVRLAKSSQFLVLDSQDKDEWHEKTLEMPTNRASSVEFRVNASALGLIELHVIAEDLEDRVKDEVKQNLLVKPEGEMRPRALTKLLLLNSNATLHETFHIKWPESKIVPGSKKVEVKVTGNVMGQSLSNLKNLVSMPFGCGEQNMITTVPNIYGLTYIRATDQTGLEDMEKEMITNMKTGYQRQVDNYRHKDGSYSAWGDHKNEAAKGSVWLTAFVLRSFSQASEFISVDPNVLSSAALFLSSKQKSSGSFEETGQVFHREMQSGTGSGASLTVYVLISLLEANRAAGGELLDLQKQIDLATGYIKENLHPQSLKQSGNKFQAMMAAYALSLLSDKSVVPLIDQLLEVVAVWSAPWIDESNPVYKKTGGNVKIHSIYTAHPSSLDVEAAAYCLLTLTHLKRFGEGSFVMKWLQSQQNSLGGYYSTQDTVMVLQALSEFGVAFTSSPPASLVNIREPVSGQSFNISLQGSRSVLLQSVELPENTNTVEVSVSGAANSYCVVKVVYTYYTLAGEDDLALSEPEVTLYTKTSKVSNTIHRVEACVRSSTSLKYNGMFVTTLTLPSGEEAYDEPSTILSSNPRVSRVETGEGLIHFYINEPPGEGYCLHAQVERQMDFEVQKPGSAKLYAYYQTETFSEVPLVLEEVSHDSGSTVLLNMASVLLTAIICVLVSLLLCM